MARERIVPSTNALRALRRLAIGPWEVPQPETQQSLRAPREDGRHETDKLSHGATAKFSPFTPVALNAERGKDISESRLGFSEVLNVQEKAAAAGRIAKSSATKGIFEALGGLTDDKEDTSDLVRSWSSFSAHDTPQTNNVDKQVRATRALQREAKEQILFAVIQGNHEEAAKLLQSACLDLAATGNSGDWEQVRFMLRWGLNMIGSNNYLPLRQALVESLLSMPEPRLEAVELLLLGKKDSSSSTAMRTSYEQSTRGGQEPGLAQRHRDGLADQSLVKYLQTFCHHHPDLDSRFAETVKIYRGLKLLGHKLNVDLMLPALRSARYTDHVDRAHKMFTTICEEFNLSPSTKIFHVLLQCFARVRPGQGDWSRVNELITLSHELGYSRSKSSKHAQLVLTAAIAYAQSVSPTRLHDFLTYHVQETGLVPTRALNRWIFIHFLESERFDLAQKWAHLLYSCFPGTTHLITNDPLFAHDLTTHWENKAASCTDILATCKILVHGAVRSPFSEDLRLLIRESVTGHLRNRAKHAGLSRISGRSLGDLMDMNNLLDSLQRQLDHLSKHRPPSGWHSNQILMRSDLQLQIDAAKTITHMLEDYKKFLHDHMWITAVPLTPAPSETAVMRKSLGTKILNVSGQKWLQGTLDERLANFQQHENKSVLRGLVDEMVVCLSSEARYRELAHLLQLLNGLPISTEVMTPKILRTWISAAFRSANLDIFRNALWALLESPPGHIIPLKTLLFVCTVIKTFEVPDSRKTLVHDHLTDLRYLRFRIFRRWWMERRCPDLSNFRNTHLAACYKELIEFDSGAHRQGEVLNTLELQQPHELPFDCQNKILEKSSPDAVFESVVSKDCKSEQLDGEATLHHFEENDMEEEFESVAYSV